MATLNLGRIKPVFRGAYAGGTAYVVDDIVTSGNETFICILASTGNATSNATYWTKLAAKGTDGTDVGTTITTQGDILFRDGSGLQRLAKGTASQKLAMNAGATAPEWVTAAGADVVKIASSTIDSGNPAYIDFQGCFTTDYRMYELRWSGITFDSSNYPEIGFLKASDNSLLSTGTYYSKAIQLASPLNASSRGDWAQNDGQGFRPINTWEWSSTNWNVYNIGKMTFHDPLDSTIHKFVTFESTFASGTVPNAATQGRNWGYGGMQDATSCSGIRFGGNGGDYENDTKAVVAIYGIKH